MYCIKWESEDSWMEAGATGSVKATRLTATAISTRSSPSPMVTRPAPSPTTPTASSRQRREGRARLVRGGTRLSRPGRDALVASDTESFLWDGLALIQRGDEQFMNEPHIGNAPQKLCFEGEPRAERRARRARKGPRGNPVASSKGTSYFNDMLGMTVGSKTNGKYSAAALTAFGEDLSTSLADDSS